MGKRGPSQGSGGRPKTKTDNQSKIQRLRMRKSRAKKRGDLRKVAQINLEIDRIIKEYTKVKQSTMAELEKRISVLEAENKHLRDEPKFPRSPIWPDPQFKGMVKHWLKQISVNCFSLTFESLNQ
jgi:hypothetical protein